VIDLSKAYKNSGNSANGPRNDNNIKDRTITKSNPLIKLLTPSSADTARNQTMMNIHHTVTGGRNRSKFEIIQPPHPSAGEGNDVQATTIKLNKYSIFFFAVIFFRTIFL
jgi:hypothetical protein